MPPREELIKVGGVDVHTVTGGTGAPLLVLHGAGGGAGFTRSMRALAERYTLWLPSHPGYGQSGDAEWMESVADLAKFYLWFIEAAGLGRPHVLGSSIGGWTAATMATMSPAAIDRLVLVAPAGLKPEKGEIFDVFYHTPAQRRDALFHDPKQVPEWDELYATPPTPAQLEIAERNLEMTARLAWKPYMHDPTLPHFLPRVTNRTLIVWGREDKVVPVECGELYRRAMPNASLTVLEKCGHVPPVERPDEFARLVLDFLGAK